MHDYRQIGRMLIAKGRITERQLQTALKGRRGSRRRIGEVLTDLGLVSELDVAECLAEQFGLQMVDPATLSPSPDALNAIPKDVAMEYRVLPVRYTWDDISCVVADPLDFPASDMIARISGRRVLLQLAPATQLIVAIMRAYGIVHADTPIPKLRRVRTARIKPQTDRQTILALLAGDASAESALAEGR